MYEEIGFACEWLGTQGEKSMFIVANPLQAFQAYYLAVFNGILPHLRPVELLEIQPFYVVGKLFQAILILFDPRGWNPFSCSIRYQRRHVTSTF